MQAWKGVNRRLVFHKPPAHAVPKYDPAAVKPVRVQVRPCAVRQERGPVTRPRCPRGIVGTPVVGPFRRASVPLLEASIQPFDPPSSSS